MTKKTERPTRQFAVSFILHNEHIERGASVFKELVEAYGMKDCYQRAIARGADVFGVEKEKVNVEMIEMKQQSNISTPVNPGVIGRV